MKSLIFAMVCLITTHGSARAQYEPPSFYQPSSYHAGSLNLGLADRADTSALEITLGGWYGSSGTGAFVDGVVGASWAIGHGTPYDILDLDVGYAISLEGRGRTSLLVRGGFSWWGKNDKTDGSGANGGVEVRHFFRSRLGSDVAYKWRHFAGVAGPSLTAGLILR